MYKKFLVMDHMGDVIQGFYRISNSKSIKSSCYTEKVIFDHRLSTVLICDNNSQVIKLIKPRTWHEEIKLLWNKSRVHVEYNGSKILKEAGLMVPEIHEIGIRHPWQYKTEYIGYILMQNLYTVGKPIHDIIESKEYDLNFSTVIANLLEHDLRKMKYHQVIYSDLHFKNIFISHNRKNLFFIDTGAIKISNKARFEKSFDKMLRKFSKNSAYQILSQKQISKLLTLSVKI